MDDPHPRSGFSLVELLVVIGVLGILMAILVPTLGKAREQGRETYCINNLRQWGMGIHMYANQNRQSMPDDGEDGEAGTPLKSWSDSKLWFNGVPPLVSGKPYNELQTIMAAGGLRLPADGDSSLFVCPSATMAFGAFGAEQNAVQNDAPSGYFKIYGPGTPNTRPSYLCYVWNSKLNADENGRDLPNVKLTQFKASSETVMMVEKRMNPKELSNSDMNRNRTLARLKSDRKRFAARHRKGGYLLFVDGHVAWFSNKEANTLPSLLNTNYNQPGKLIWAPRGMAD